MHTHKYLCACMYVHTGTHVITEMHFSIALALPRTSTHILIQLPHLTKGFRWDLPDRALCTFFLAPLTEGAWRGEEGRRGKVRGEEEILHRRVKAMCCGSSFVHHAVNLCNHHQSGVSLMHGVQVEPVVDLCFAFLPECPLQSG